MALIETFNLTETTHLYLWELTEEIPELYHLARLTEEEVEKYSTFSAVCRQREWLAIRALLNEIFGSKTHVTYSVMGKPYIDKGKHVSFSHCHKYVAVLTSTEAPVGVDIEVLNKRALAVKERVLSDEELSTLTKNTELQQVLVYWSLKEVLYKIARVGLLDFRKNLFLSPVNFQNQEENIVGVIHKGDVKTSAKLAYMLKNDWVIAWGMQTN